MLTSRLVIAGAGDFAREVLWLCMEIPPDQRQWSRICFIDDNMEVARGRMQRYQVDIPVIETINDFLPCEGDLLICAIGNPRSKLDACRQLKAKGGCFTNIIHPTVAIGTGTKLGQGLIMARLSGLSVDVSIGDFVTINTYSFCGHDVVLEDGCTISSHCDITGHAHLHRGVFLGSHATVLPRIQVGEFAAVGAGSVAFCNVKAGQTILGVPGKVFFRPE
jgi:sugar O-acyltransferase (sialic acid O-acetyltransferase NeuD family)